MSATKLATNLSIRKMQVPLNFNLTNEHGNPMVFFLRESSGLVSLKIESANSEYVVLTQNANPFGTKPSETITPLIHEMVKGPEPDKLQLDSKVVDQAVDQARKPIRAPDADVRESRLKDLSSKSKQSELCVPNIIAPLSIRKANEPKSGPPNAFCKEDSKRPGLFETPSRPKNALAFTETVKSQCDIPTIVAPPGLHRTTPTIAPAKESRRSTPVSEASRRPVSRQPASDLPAPPSGLVPNPTRKIYCTHWINTGTCSFNQTGCKYKHEIPPRTLWEAVGIKELPQWWRDLQARNVRVVPKGAPSEQSGGLAKGLQEIEYQHRVKRVLAKPKACARRASISSDAGDEAVVPNGKGLGSSRFAGTLTSQR
jgi:hypothetical protein